MIDPVTGKKLTKKRIQQLYQAGQLSQQHIVELEKKGILNPDKQAQNEPELNNDKQQQLKDLDKKSFDIGKKLIEMTE